MANAKYKLSVVFKELPMGHPVPHLAGLAGCHVQTIWGMSKRFEEGIGDKPGQLSPRDAEWLLTTTDRICMDRANPVRELIEPPLEKFYAMQG